MNHSNVNHAMFNLGTGEIVIIFLVILLIFGAKKLPELARGLGEGINEFKDAVDKSKKDITNMNSHLHRGGYQRKKMILISADKKRNLVSNSCIQ